MQFVDKRTDQIAPAPAVITPAQRQRHRLHAPGRIEPVETGLPLHHRQRLEIAQQQFMRAHEWWLLCDLRAGGIVTLFPEGTRSKTHTLAKGHAGLGMIALRSGVPVVPVAIWGSEHALKKFRPRVTIAFGPPIVLKPKGAKITREDIDEGTERVMRSIASMMPPEYRGVYGEQEHPNEGG